MGAPSRFQNGLNSSSGNDTTNMMGQIDPSYYHTLFADFDTFAAANWVITRVGTTPTEALVAGDGGLLLLTTSTGATDSTFLQDLAASYTIDATVPLYLKTRVALSDANLSQFIFGTQNTNTAPLTGSATNGIWLVKAIGVNQLSLVSRSAGVTTTLLLPVTLVNNQTYNLGLAYDGRGNVEAWVDDAKMGSVTPTALPVGVTGVVFGLQNGAAVAKTATIDYIFAAKPR